MEAGISRSEPQVWAVGGGKGGVGKSVFTVNLGAVLVRRNLRVAIVDADLGGANLHTLIGLDSPRPTLADFLERRITNLEDVLLPTGIRGLSLLSGARAMVQAANPKYAQKEKILRHLCNLPVDVVLLDLGGGSAFNVLDFFIAAHLSILVVVPEHTSVENAYQFLKAAFYRKLQRVQPRAEVSRILKDLMRRKTELGISTPGDLISAVGNFAPEMAVKMATALKGFKPTIVVNRVQLPRERDLADEIARASTTYFGTPVSAAGWIDADPLLVRSVQERKPAVERYPGGSFSKAMMRIANTLVLTTGL
ncbi:MAG: P-loop NTPase [Thermoanaerobaculales bacterium]|nr:P-loop NTPase [Thermoanaerobaculales bacterium]